MQSKNLIILAGLFLFSSISKAQNKADDIIGNWLTTGKEPAKIQIYKSGEKYYGKIVWLKTPTTNGKPKVDNNNPDKAKRNNPVIGLVILIGFKFDSDDEWQGGDIYDPESGKTYSSYLYLKDINTLKVRGYVGISLFGRTETWSRTN
jgi:uncharacterized protein (DUF2147 family)